MQLRNEFSVFVHKEMHASDAKTTNSVGLIGQHVPHWLTRIQTQILFATLYFWWLIRCVYTIHFSDSYCWSGIFGSIFLRPVFLLMDLQVHYWYSLLPVIVQIALRKKIYIYVSKLRVHLLIVGTSTLIWSHTEKIILPSASSRGLYKNENYLMRSRTFNM